MDEICKAQKLMFKLMKLASFNNFDGRMVVKNLETHRELWKSCVMDGNDLIKLRDLSKNDWNTDTLYILTTGVNDELLEHIAKDLWGADKVTYLDKDEASHRLGKFPCEDKVLMIWWD